jgi:hypothetical protein
MKVCTSCGSPHDSLTSSFISADRISDEWFVGSTRICNECAIETKKRGFTVDAQAYYKHMLGISAPVVMP